jgi:hypothetical protein
MPHYVTCTHVTDNVGGHPRQIFQDGKNNVRQTTYHGSPLGQVSVPLENGEFERNKKNWDLTRLTNNNSYKIPHRATTMRNSRPRCWHLPLPLMPLRHQSNGKRQTHPLSSRLICFIKRAQLLSCSQIYFVVVKWITVKADSCNQCPLIS